MAYKMKGHSLPGPNQKKKKIDPDAPGTPGTPGYEPEVKSMDYLTKTPVGPRAKDTKVDPFSKEEADIENKTNDPGTVPLFSDDAHDKVRAKKKKKGAPNMKTGKYKHNF